MYHASTDIKVKQNALDRKIHMYETKVVDAAKRHEQNYQPVNELIRLNGIPGIAFHDRTIVSFHEIKNWGSYQFIEHQYRAIDPAKQFERAMLEKLLLRELERTSYAKRHYNSLHGEFLIKEEQIVGNLSIRGCLTFQCNIDTDGNIFFGCDYSHRFSKKQSIAQALKEGKIKEGCAVVDRYRKEYQFVRVSGYTVREKIDSWGQSIVEYYQNRKEGKILDKVPPDTKVIVVKTKNHDQELYYAPQLLFEKSSLDSIPPALQKKVNQVIKMSADKKMKLIIDHSMNILNASEHLTLEKGGFLVENQGFRTRQFSPPALVFGQNQEHVTPSQGLTRFGVYQSTNAPLRINFLVDNHIVALMKNPSSQHLGIFEGFVEDLLNLSDQLHVPIEKVNVGSKIGYNDLTFSDRFQLRKKLRTITEHLHYTTVVLLDIHNKEAYEVLKQELSGKAGIPIQVIYFDTIHSETTRKFSLLNILLGIYAKSGIQPWILKEPLLRDCYIGLDVSHEEGRHSAGMTQVVGKDGRVLAASAISGNEAGEIISKQTFENIIHEAIHSYEKTYGRIPENMVFHRDGKGSDEEIKRIKEIVHPSTITFDYVAIKKNVNRRMASFNTVQKKWETIQGMAYIKGIEAYMCTTNPRAAVGMADPIKIEHLYGNQQLEEILKEIYALSFMHIGALNKSRLPITTHYADKSSTFYNRGMLPTVGKEKAIYFV
jgi:hypothetical protein